MDYKDDYQTVEYYLNSLSGRASHLLYENFILCKPMYKKDSELPNDFQFISSQLLSSCHTTSESALVLISKNRLWDTELLVRSLTEGTIKFLYMIIGDRHDRNQKSYEYWEVIPEIKRISKHYKAVYFLNQLNSSSEQIELVKESLLEASELDELEKKYPQKARRELEMKWSFSKMVHSLIEYELNNDAIISSYYSYSIGSHLVHQDGDAVYYKWDRLVKNINGNYKPDIAHASKLIVEILNLSMARTIYYYELYSLDKQKIAEIRKLIEQFNKELFDNM